MERRRYLREHLEAAEQELRRLEEYRGSYQANRGAPPPQRLDTRIERAAARVAELEGRLQEAES